MKILGIMEMFVETHISNIYLSHFMFKLVYYNNYFIILN